MAWMTLACSFFALPPYITPGRYVYEREVHVSGKQNHQQLHAERIENFLAQQLLEVDAQVLGEHGHLGV